MGVAVNENLNFMPKTERRIRVAWICPIRLQWGIYDKSVFPLTRMDRMPKIEAMDELLYECEPWTLG